jgi:hypothetical protein
VIVPVFKTGGRQVILPPVGSTPTRFRQYFSITYIATVLVNGFLADRLKNLVRESHILHRARQHDPAD